MLDRANPPDPSGAPASTFLRGLTMGALVGAAIAGTLLLGRRRRGRDLIEPQIQGSARSTTTADGQARR